MDPTIELIKRSEGFGYLSSLISKGLDIDSVSIKHDSKGNEIKFGSDTRSISTSTNPAEVKKELIDVKQFKRVQDMKSKIPSDKQYITIRDKANPFGDIGRSISPYRTFIKLANIDALFGVSEYTTSSKRSNTERKFKFLDLGAARGGFTQYIQYRYPLSIGTGMTLKRNAYNKALTWDDNIIDKKRFTKYYGPTGTGDLYKESIDLAAQMNMSQGVNLVVADAAYSVTGRESIQEQQSTRIQMMECYVALRSLVQGGNFVLKMYEVNTKPSIDLLYMLANVFKRVYMMKPITSRPANSERYVICMDLNKGKRVQFFTTTMSNANSKLKNGGYLENLLKWDNKDFYKRIKELNNTILEIQETNLQRIFDLIDGKEIFDYGYAIEDVFHIWDIPNSPDRYIFNKVAKYDREMDEQIYLMSEFSDEQYASLFKDIVSQLVGTMEKELSSYIDEVVSQSIKYKEFDAIYTVLKRGDYGSNFHRPNVKVPQNLLDYLEKVKDKNILFAEYNPTISESAIGTGNEITRISIGDSKSRKVEQIDIRSSQKFDIVVLYKSFMFEGRESISKYEKFVKDEGIMLVCGYPGPFMRKRYSVMKVITKLEYLKSVRNVIDIINVSQNEIVDVAGTVSLNLTGSIAPEDKPDGMYIMEFTKGTVDKPVRLSPVDVRVKKPIRKKPTRRSPKVSSKSRPGATKGKKKIKKIWMKK